MHGIAPFTAVYYRYVGPPLYPDGLLLPISQVFSSSTAAYEWLVQSVITDPQSDCRGEIFDAWAKCLFSDYIDAASNHAH